LRKGAADFRLLSRNVFNIFGRDERANPFLRRLVTGSGFASYLSFTPAARDQGRSKYNVLALFQFALNGLCSFSKWPLRFCITAGLGLSILSLLFAGFQVVTYLLGTVDVPGWASLFFIVSFFGGIQLFFIGVLGEYIGLIFDEVKKRPRYLVSQRYQSRGPDQITGAEGIKSQDRQGPNGVT
jgi:dolichol-phosphate mannosyltransferase